MPNEHYSNRELDQKLDNILDLIEGNRVASKDQLDRIEAQTTRTNGRVSSLEKWQSYVIGFCAAVSFLILPVIFILISRTM
jgi:hypothetical protein